MRFPGRFAPSEGFTNRLEKPYRDEICLNGYWNFQPGAGCTGAWDSVRIRIPSPWNVNGFAWNGLEGPDHRDYPSYLASWNEVREAWMQRTVRVPADWAGDRIFLHFEAVAGKAQVFVNGGKVAENFDLFLPFGFRYRCRIGVLGGGIGLLLFLVVRSQGRRNHLLLVAGKEKAKRNREECPPFHGHKDNRLSLIFA